MTLGIRWTIGDVRDRGFEALRLSIWGAWQIFGDSASYCVCVNSIDVATAASRTGYVPGEVQWRDVSCDVPNILRRSFDHAMAEGVAWKLAPLRVFPNMHELSLDNDCVLWKLPPIISNWLDQTSACLLAEDVVRCFGRFDALCPEGPRNAGIRGLPPRFDLTRAIVNVISRLAPDSPLSSELDEQGLQTAALSLDCPAMMVPLDDVAICSPFHPHLPHLGRCGAHFVGLNARHIPFDYYDRPADECMSEHWERHMPDILRRIPRAQLQEVQ